MKCFVLILFALCWGNISAQKKSPLMHIEPPNWWAGMEHHQVQLLLHGTNIREDSISIPGLPILEVKRTSNPNYLFVTIETKGRNPGMYPIEITRGKKTIASLSYELKEREYQSKERTSFTPSDVIYLLMPDRFANQITGIDTYPGMAEPANRSLPGGRHGGDIMGIMDHLDYIKELGATTIWTTPLLEDNEPTYSYHGYAQSNLYQVDPRYGSTSWYKELVREAHRKGLKVIKDEVPNHWSSKHWMIQDLPTQDWIHQFPTFTRSSYRTSTQMDPYATAMDKRASEEGWFDNSMPDINQSNPLVLKYLIQNTLWWIEYAELDGLRVDTYSYNDKHAIAQWTKAIREEYPNLNLVGEIWMHDQAQISYWQDNSPIGALDQYNSHLPSVMDFTLHDAILLAFNERNQGWDQGMVRIYENFVNDFLYANPNNVLIFMENHDTKRFNEYCPTLQDYKLALTLIATTRGIPQIYYGTEIGMKGSKDVGDADIRRDFPGGWETDPQTAFYSEDNPLKKHQKGRTSDQEAYFQFTKKILNWRKTKEVIHKGQLIQFVPQDNCYVYFRVLEGQKVMVVINNNVAPTTLKLDRFREVLGNAGSGKEVLSGSPVYLNVPSMEVGAKTALIIEVQ